MFDLFGGVTSLRRARANLDSSLKALKVDESPAMWTYPVVRESCGCGASTETVLYCVEKTEKFFEKWRRVHACTLRKEQEANQDS